MHEANDAVVVVVGADADPFRNLGGVDLGHRRGDSPQRAGGRRFRLGRDRLGRLARRRRRLLLRRGLRSRGGLGWVYGFRRGTAGNRKR